MSNPHNKQLNMEEIINKPDYEPLLWIPEKGDLKCPLCGYDLTKYFLEDRTTILNIFTYEFADLYVFSCTKCRRSYAIKIDKLYDAIYELL